MFVSTWVTSNLVLKMLYLRLARAFSSLWLFGSPCWNVAECCSRVKSSVNTLKSTPVRLLTRSVFVKNQAVVCFHSKLFSVLLGKYCEKVCVAKKKRKKSSPHKLNLIHHYCFSGVSQVFFLLKSIWTNYEDTVLQQFGPVCELRWFWVRVWRKSTVNLVKGS